MTSLAIRLDDNSVSLPLERSHAAGRVASHTASAPEPPTAWAAALGQLTQHDRSSDLDPAPWTNLLCGHVASQTRTSSRRLDDLGHVDGVVQAGVVLQLGLAGWGNVQSRGGAPQRISPGDLLVTPIPSQCQCVVPVESPGWTYAWLRIGHPYMTERLARVVSLSGAHVSIPSDGPLTARLLRLVRAAIGNDFPDPWQAELELFECVLAFERWVRRPRDSGSEVQRFKDEVRSHILAGLPEGIALRDLAAEFGLSRCHFSYLFRRRTGMTLSRFAMAARIDLAATMLRETVEPLKAIASACGFSSPNHFARVFRRLRQASPAAFRQAGC